MCTLSPQSGCNVCIYKQYFACSRRSNWKPFVLSLSLSLSFVYTHTHKHTQCARAHLFWLERNFRCLLFSVFGFTHTQYISLSLTLYTICVCNFDMLDFGYIFHFHRVYLMDLCVWVLCQSIDISMLALLVGLIYYNNMYAMRILERLRVLHVNFLIISCALNFVGK